MSHMQWRRNVFGQEGGVQSIKYNLTWTQCYQAWSRIQECSMEESSAHFLAIKRCIPVWMRSRLVAKSSQTYSQVFGILLQI